MATNRMMQAPIGAYCIAVIKAGVAYHHTDGRTYTAHDVIPRGCFAVDSEYHGGRHIYRPPAGTSAMEFRRAAAVAFDAKMTGQRPYYTANREG